MKDINKLIDDLKEALTEYRAKDAGKVKNCILYELLGSEFYDFSILSRQDGVFQAILDNIPVGVYFKGTDGLYWACNNALSALYGVDKEDVIGKTAYDFFPKDVADRFAESDRELIELQTSRRIEHRGRFPLNDDGFHIIQKQAFIQDGQVKGIIGVITDMTEQKGIEDRAWASGAFFKSLYETSPLPIILINSMNMITDVNSAAEKFFAFHGVLPGQEADTIFASYHDYETALEKVGGTLTVNLVLGDGVKKQVVVMVSGGVYSGESYKAFAFMNMDIK